MPVFTAADGARILYDDVGHGRPILMLHGFMADRGFFRDQAPLADRFRLISVDLRGHGESDGGANPGIEAMATDIAALAAHLDLQEVVGIGWSLGATILWHVLGGSEAWRFAAAVIVDMTPRVLNAQGWTLGLSAETCEARSQAIANDFPAFGAMAGRAIFADPQRDEADRASRSFARNDPAAMASIWTSLVADDLRPRLGTIGQPTLIVRGRHSHLYDAATTEYLVAALPAARAVEFERSGHSPHIEESERFNRTIRDFVAGLARPRTANAS